MESDAMALRVLVVDDTEHVRSMLAEMLRLDGFEVVGEAADGLAAVELAEATSPDVIIMDLRMPRLDGIDATRRIREREPKQLVVLYTAYLDPEIEARARAAGVAACQAKVGGIADLERQLARIAVELTGTGG
jgi:response regulator NasT